MQHEKACLEELRKTPADMSKDFEMTVAPSFGIIPDSSLSHPTSVLSTKSVDTSEQIQNVITSGCHLGENSSSSHHPPLDYCKCFLTGLSALTLLFPQSILCPETRWSLLKPNSDGIMSLFKRLPMASRVYKNKSQSPYDQPSLHPISCFAKLISWPRPSCSLCSSCNDPLVISHTCQEGYLLLILLLQYFSPRYLCISVVTSWSLCKVTFTIRFSLSLYSNTSPLITT